MKPILLILAVLASGCDTLAKYTENIAACSLDRTELVVASMYGPVGIASKVRKADAAAVCQK